MRSERVFLLSGRRDLRYAFLVVEHVFAKYRRVAAGRAQQLRDVHQVVFVRFHDLQIIAIITTAIHPSGVRGYSNSTQQLTLLYSCL